MTENNNTTRTSPTPPSGTQQSGSARKSKYNWIETVETTRVNSSDFQDIAHGKRAWWTLLIVSILAVLAGWTMISLLPSANKTVIPQTAATVFLAKDFFLDESFKMSIKGASAITAGLGETFFVVVKDSIEQYDRVSGKVAQWSIPKDKEKNKENVTEQEKANKESASVAEPVPTALCFARNIDTTSLISGKLFFARGNKVWYIDPSKKGREPVSIPVRTEPNALITAIAASDDFLFFADYNNRRIYRYDFRDKSKRFVFGQEEDSSGFPGFRLSKVPCFDIVFSTKGNVILATNSGCFRIEAFNPDTGIWMKDFSWGQGPWETNGFTGCCNPVGLNVLDDGGIITSDKGKRPLLRLFDADGRFSSQINDPDKSPPLDGRNMLKSTLLNDGCLLVLAPNGEISIYERRQAQPPVPAVETETK